MIAIVSPCFNEQNTVLSFLQRLEGVLMNTPEKFHVIIVDDCSEDDSLKQLSQFSFRFSQLRFTVLQLKFNLGQQGAIHQGLLYAAKFQPEHAIVMDCDGDDDPGAIPMLLANRNFQVVQVRSGGQSEGLLFRIMYWFYKSIFRITTGKTINFRNYSMIGNDTLERIRHTSFVHYPAYLLKQKASMTTIRHDSAKRIDSKSKIGYTELFLHAFKSMIEFAEDLILLFFRLFLINTVLFAVLMIDIIYQKLIAHTAVPGWFTTIAIGLIILAVLSIGFFIIGILLLNLIHQQNSKSYKEIYTIVNHSEPAQTVS
jgi:glycosyltransferase involved in cell wall biosynthesis